MTTTIRLFKGRIYGRKQVASDAKKAGMTHNKKTPKHIQNAHTVKKIRESNMSEAKKAEEIEKLRQKRSLKDRVFGRKHTRGVYR